MDLGIPQTKPHHIKSSLSFHLLLACTMLMGTAGCFNNTQSQGSLSLRSPRAASLQISSLRADASSGASVAVPADLVELAGQLQIEEGAQIANESMAAALNLGEESVSSAGPSVHISASVAADLSQIGRLQISIPFSDPVAFKLASSYLVVVYQVLDKDGKMVAGLLPASALTIEASNIKFKMLGFGSYQAARVPMEVKEEIKVQTQETKILTKEEKESLPPIAAAGISPIIAKKGQTVTITGKNFKPGIKLAFLGRSIAQVTVRDDQTLTALIDDVPRLGKGTLYLSQNGSEARIALAYSGSDSDFPLITLPAAQVCSGQKFYNANGELLEGSKVCSAAIADCTSDGQVGCVAVGPAFAAAITSGAAAKILSGQTLAGISGTAAYPVTCTAANQSGCIATATYKTMDLSAAGAGTGLTAANFEATIKSAGNFEFWDASGSRHTFAGNVSLTPANIKSAVTIFGVTGSLTGSPANCASDGASNCLVDGGTYVAAQISGAAAKIIGGQTLAGIAGSAMLPSVGKVLSGISYGAGGTALTGTLTLPAASFVKVGSASYGDPGALVTPTYSPDFPSVANVRANDTVDGTAGTLSDCVAGDLSGCVTTASYKSMNLSAAGGATGLTSSNFNTLLKSNAAFEFWDASGTRHQLSGDSDLTAANIANLVDIFGVVGSATLESHSNCSAANQAGCVATNTYKTMDLSTVGGATGLTSANFNSNLAGGAALEFWTATGARQQVAGSSLLNPANIKAGTSIFGITGAYPSVSFPLSSSTGTPDLTTFVTQLTTDGTFEYFDSTGARFTGSGDSDLVAGNIKNGVAIESLSLTGSWGAAPNPWDLRVGTNVNGVSGALKTSCRNRVSSSLFNSDSIPGNSSVTGGVTADWWDTVDDSNNLSIFPSSLVAAWNAGTDCAADVWEDISSSACTSAATDCVIRDRISGLQWSESYPAAGTGPASSPATWSAALNKCDALTYGSKSDWRLPTQKELMEAYVHGIRAVGYVGTGTTRPSGVTVDNNDYFVSNIQGTFWSATTSSSQTSSAWAVTLGTGESLSTVKGTTYQVICVR